MRLATVEYQGEALPAVVGDGDAIHLVRDLVPDAPASMIELIAGGEAMLSALAAGSSPAVEGATLLAPIPRPSRCVYCVGWNYLEHFEEGKGKRGGNYEPVAIPDFPTLFSKPPTSVTGPNSGVFHPAPYSEQLDWEVELAVIIGKGGRNISSDAAMSHVYGYTIGVDVSVRDLQRKHGQQWFKGKGLDTHCPLGPWIVTADEIPDPYDLHLELSVNGDVKQSDSTSLMVFQIPRIIEEFSIGMALEPGDVILSGTPSGIGYARTPPQFMVVGDEMKATITGIGELVNHIVPMP